MLGHRQRNELTVTTSPALIPEDPAAALLEEALRIVTGARRNNYGNPEDNFACIAALWTTMARRVGIDFTDPSQSFTAEQVALMMILMKAARLCETPGHRDSLVDIAGYAACGFRCSSNAQQPKDG